MKVTQSDDLVTGVAGLALVGPLLDRLGLVAEADRWGLRPIGPGGYTGGECYRTLVEMMLAGGDVVTDRCLLDGEANARLRGGHSLPSHWTLGRFGRGADLGRVQKAAALNRTMLARGWALGAGPAGRLVTLDPDATNVATYGVGKEGSKFARTGQTQLSPLVGVCGETGDVVALRARSGNAHPGRAIASFTRECYYAVPAAVRAYANTWVRIDSAGYQTEVIDECNRLGAAYTITAPQNTAVKATIQALIDATSDDDDTDDDDTDDDTDDDDTDDDDTDDDDTDDDDTDDDGYRVVWEPALGSEAAAGSQVTECLFILGASGPTKDQRLVRMVVRRQPTSHNDQLDIDDIDGWRYQAVITNLPNMIAPAAMVEHHHRLRGGIPEDANRQLKEDFALNHAPFENFFANWLWWHATALAHNVARWLRVLTLPDEFHRCRAKRWRNGFICVAARVINHARRVELRLAGNYNRAATFIEALTRIRALPAFV